MITKVLQNSDRGSRKRHYEKYITHIKHRKTPRNTRSRGLGPSVELLETEIKIEVLDVDFYTFFYKIRLNDIISAPVAVNLNVVPNTAEALIKADRGAYFEVTISVCKNDR